MRNSQDMSSFRVQIDPPDSACNKEISIHSFLDDIGAFKINTSEYVHQVQRLESKGVQKAFADLASR